MGVIAGISVGLHASVNGSASGNHRETYMRRSSADGWGVFKGKSRPIRAAGLNLLDDRGPDVKVNPSCSPGYQTTPTHLSQDSLLDSWLIWVGAWDKSGVKRAADPRVVHCIDGIVFLIAATRLVSGEQRQMTTRGKRGSVNTEQQTRLKGTDYIRLI